MERGQLVRVLEFKLLQQFQLTWAQLDRPLGKAAEGRRSPRRCARHNDS
jgi:hypothetical protein